MRFLKYALLIFFISCTPLSYADATIPLINLTDSKQAVVQYFESGEYEQDVEKVIFPAKNYLLTRVKQNQHASHPKKLAIILDIDDTALSNYKNIKNRDFSNSVALIEKSYRLANSTAVKPVHDLYEAALSHNVAVFFVTFRPSEFKSYTIKNLKHENYQHWTRIYFPDAKDLKAGSADYRIRIRKLIKNQGYSVLLNVGDQWGDLKGGFYEKGIKIPNPMYCVSSTPCMSSTK